MRDLDMHVNLFVPDVRVEKKVGRQALKEWADATFRDQFTAPRIKLETTL